MKKSFFFITLFILFTATSALAQGPGNNAEPTKTDAMSILMVYGGVLHLVVFGAAVIAARHLMLKIHKEFAALNPVYPKGKVDKYFAGIAALISLAWIVVYVTYWMYNNIR